MKTIQFDEVVHETELAILFKFDDEDVWIPRSAMGELDGNENTIEVERWFVVNEELDMFEI